MTRRWAVLAVCALSMFLVGLDTTIATVGLPAIGAGLGAGTRQLEWVVDAYVIALAGLLITAGAVADRFGRRRLFRLGLAVFGAGSLACALAPSVEFLIAARVLQGSGASLLNPVALAIVVTAMPDPRERARAIGVWASVFGLSMAAGPVLGGVLVSALDWRWLFWINVPLVALALLLSAIVLPESRSPKPRPLDLPGQALLTVVVGVTVAVLIEGPHRGWDAPGALVAYTVLVVAAPAFVLVEQRRANPLVDLGLFRRPAFATAVLGAVAVFVALAAMLLLTTFHLQHARGWTALEAGAASLPLALAVIVCAPLSGVLTGRYGPRRPLLLAATFLTAGGLLLLGVEDGLLPAAYLCFGIGFGFANAPITDTAVAGLPPERAAVAGAMTSTARQIGVATGIAVAGGLLAGRTPVEIAPAARTGGIVVAACGAFLFVAAASNGKVAAASNAKRAPEDRRPLRKS